MLNACSTASGEGEFGGSVKADDCKLDTPSYQLHPTFFAAQILEGFLEIRLQHEGDNEILSDGIRMLVLDPTGIKKNKLGMELAVANSPQAPIQLTLYLNHTCPKYRFENTVSMIAVSGSGKFSAIYAPDVNEESEIAFELKSIQFENASQNVERTALLSGNARFPYARGRPQQRFP